MRRSAGSFQVIFFLFDIKNKNGMKDGVWSFIFQNLKDMLYSADIFQRDKYFFGNIFRDSR